MMKFWTSAYLLYPKAWPNSKSNSLPREGALLKVEWPDSKVGFGDIFPWPEFGDISVENQLKELERGNLTDIVEQTISLARQDAILRSAGKNAFENIEKVKNHYLIMDYTSLTRENLEKIKSDGFSTLKIKVGRSWKEEANWINKTLYKSDFKIRLDFNSNFDLPSLQKMLTMLSPSLKKKVEFIEDPFPWNFEVWKQASSLAPLALDQEFDKVPWKSFQDLKTPVELPFQVVVIKPSRRDVHIAVKRALEYKLKMVVTSSLDHSVGIAHSLRVAAELKEKYQDNMLESGCLSFDSYNPDDFSTKVEIAGPFLKQIPGKGIGFDENLEAISWKPLNQIIS